MENERGVRILLKRMLQEWSGGGGGLVYYGPGLGQLMGCSAHRTASLVPPSTGSYYSRWDKFYC
jgi:hypothetical protein